MKRALETLPRPALALAVLAVAAASLQAQVFRLPTANRALFRRGAEADFFVGTQGKPWTSGTFGCVRSGGHQFHEGIDIRCLSRDAKGEPTDPICATAEGTVAYLSHDTRLSNYGRYAILRHPIEGLEIYSLYAHLREFRTGLREGDKVRAGEVIAVMGRSSNTREAITQARAHVHFELNLRLGQRFAAWQKARDPGQRNDHGEWNGRNFLGLDPGRLLRDQAAQGERFSLRAWIRSQPELCRVQIRKPAWAWPQWYPGLVESRPNLGEAVAGYELALNAYGLPLRVVPQSAKELAGCAKWRLVSVGEKASATSACVRPVRLNRGRWELSPRGERLLDILTY